MCKWLYDVCVSRRVIKLNDSITFRKRSYRPTFVVVFIESDHFVSAVTLIRYYGQFHSCLIIVS